MPRVYFDLPTVEIAQALIGQTIHRVANGQHFVGTITETEAYLKDDQANHAFASKTKRNAPMFEAPGTLYVYLIYGKYYCLNIATGQKGIGEAVLIRGVELMHPYHKKLDGPGKICRELVITTDDSGKKLGKKCNLWIEQNSADSSNEITALPRVGISHAPKLWRKAPLRFVLKKR